MWWTILLVAIAFIFLAVWFTRQTAVDRRRSASWNNLRERGKLIASQSAHLRDVTAQKNGPPAR